MFAIISFCRTLYVRRCGHHHVVKEHFAKDSPQVKNHEVQYANPHETIHRLGDDDWIQVDNQTHVTYSIMFYYTPEFRRDTPDIEGFLDQVLTNVNAGSI